MSQQQETFLGLGLLPLVFVLDSPEETVDQLILMMMHVDFFYSRLLLNF